MREWNAQCPCITLPGLRLAASRKEETFSGLCAGCLPPTGDRAATSSPFPVVHGGWARGHRRGTGNGSWVPGGPETPGTPLADLAPAGRPRIQGPDALGWSFSSLFLNMAAAEATAPRVGSAAGLAARGSSVGLPGPEPHRVSLPHLLWRRARRPGSARESSECSKASPPPVTGLPQGISTGRGWRPCSKSFRLMALLLQKCPAPSRARPLPPPFADQKRPREKGPGRPKSHPSLPSGVGPAGGFGEVVSLPLGASPWQ